MFKVVRHILLACLLLPTLVVADEYQAGKHYEIIANPVPTRNASKIEVVEVFWYGCSHCFHFEPMLKTWAKTLTDDVDFYHSPAMWNDRMKTHAQVFYTAEALGVLDKMHDGIFSAINVEKKKLINEAELVTFFGKYGVSEKDFKNAFNSFGVKSSVQQADSRARGYKISGTPEMIVNGKYRISGSMAGGQAKILDVANYLISKERAAKK